MRARWLALCREFGGWPTALLYCLHRGLQALSGGRVRIVPYVFFAQPVDNPLLASIKPDPATVVRVVVGPDATVPPGPRPLAALRQRLQAGNECHVCEVKGEFAGTIWLGLGPHDEDEVRCRYLLPPRSVWDYDVYVAPRYRLGRTLARLWAAVDDNLAARDIAWTFSRISRFNPGSVGVHERLGARRVGTAWFLCFGAWELSSVPGRWGPRLSRQARPVITLRAPN